METEPIPIELRNTLIRASSAVDLALPERTLERLWAAAQLLAQLARGSGISGYERPEEALIRGLGPALAYFAFPEATRKGALADLGAGNGALGAGIALICPDVQVALLDRSHRAHTACELLAARLRLANLRVHLFDARVSEQQPDAYDAVVFRALASGGEALSLTSGLVRPGGFLGAYHQAGDEGFEDGAEGAQSGLAPLATVDTLVEGLVLSGFLVNPAGSPQ